MLKFLFAWFDHHPSAYWGIAAVPTIALLLLVGVGLGRAEPEPESRWGDRFFALVAIALLFAWRWPFLLEPHVLNLDEGQLIAGAKTLLHDPVFWRSVDGTTSGPLNFYALLPLPLLGLPLDYFSARLTGLLLVSAALLACYRLFRAYAPPTPARLALAPALLFFATATDADFVHYSSEHVSLLLFALAAGCLLRPLEERPHGDARLLIGAFLAGLLPWAKLQTAPLAVALIGSGLWLVVTYRPWSPHTRMRRAAGLVIAGIAPSLLALVALVLTGQFGAFAQSYLRQNFVYVDQGVPLLGTLSALADFTSDTWSFPAFLGGWLLTLVLAGLLYGALHRRPGRLFYAGAVFVLAGLVCVLAPRRPFVHYLLLLAVPMIVVSGASLIDHWPARRFRRRYGAGLLILGCGLPLGARLVHPAPAMVGRLAESWRHPYSAAGSILRKNALKAESLAVWGWRTDLYVESGLRQATRDAHTFWSITPSPHRESYRARFLADLQHSRPQFFVDTVGPGGFTFQDRLAEGHESFPALADYLDREYSLVLDSGRDRIYARSDFQGRSSGTDPAAIRQDAGTAAAHPIEPVEAEPTRTEPANTGIWEIDRRNLRMLQPPTRMLWTLDGTEREAILEYGFHPRAYTEGWTNGADIFVELISPGHPPRPVFSCHLDPINRSADRGTRATRMTLPPLEPGTELVVRSEAGELGDAAWDWVYVAAVKFGRAPSFVLDQFPGFTRLPASAEANESVLVGDAHDRALLVNAPSTLTFPLSGRERRVSVTFGYRTCLETGGDVGALFRIEYLPIRNEGPPRALFERRLHPISNQADRGRHHAAIALPPGHEGDRLILRLVSEGGDSTRGIYLTDLILE